MTATVHSSGRPVVGVDLGGTHMQIGVVAPDNTLLGRERGKTHAHEGFTAVVQRIAGHIRHACAEAGLELDEIHAVGVGAPGTIDLATGVVTNAPNLQWRNQPLARALGEALVDARVCVDNDVTVALYGENVFGAGRNAPDVMGVWVGTGVGGGLALGGRLYRGGHGTAGEIGMTILFPDAPPGQDRMEHHCSRKAVIDQIVRRIRNGETSGITTQSGDDLESVTAGHLAASFQAGDPVVCSVVHRAADLLGIAIANQVSVLSLPLVLLGGGLTEALGQPYIDRVAASARRAIHPPEIGEVEFRMTELKDDAGLLGAAQLAREVN